MQTNDFCQSNEMKNTEGGELSFAQKSTEIARHNESRLEYFK